MKTTMGRIKVILAGIGVIVFILLAFDVWIAGWLWGMAFGVIFAFAVSLIIMSSLLEIFVLRGGAGTIVMVIALASQVCVGIAWYKSDKPKGETTPSTPSAVSATGKTTQQVVVVKKVGKEPTLHLFSDYADGCVSLNIKTHDFYWYPKGGRIIVSPPEGESFVDTPGVDITTHHGPGLWKWKAKDLNAVGVEIWQ